VAACLPGLRVRIPTGAWLSVSCECYVLSGRGLCDGTVPRPEEFYRARARACVCRCVSLSAIRCNKIPLRLQWVGRKGQPKKEA